MGAERGEGGGFAGARRAGNAEADGLAGRRQQLLNQPVRGLPVVGARALDQRDGARLRGAVAGADAGGEQSGVETAGGHAPLH